MHSLPTRLQEFLNTINYCFEQSSSCTAYLHGGALLYQLTGDEGVLTKEIKIIISYDIGFSVQELYQCLNQHIVISREIESSDNFYHVASAEFELKIDLVYQFDPTRLVQAQRLGRFNIDALFYDLSRQELRHPPEVSEDTSVLVNINDPKGWVFEDILGFARKIGALSEIKVEKNQEQSLRDISLATIQESLGTSWNDEIEDILLSRHSGSALHFLTNTFVDGMPWIFKTLVDYMISLNVPLNEESTIETVFSEKKFNLLNLYNDHFSEKKSIETADEVHHRLTTTLRLLFDSPNLVIPKPSTNRIRAMADGVSGRCCLGTKVGIDIVFVGCGEDIEEEDCLGLPVFCEGGNPCLKEHPAFSHIPDSIWETMTITNREWCPNQVCPDADNIHCLEEISSSSSEASSSSQSSSQSSSSQSSSSQSSSSQSSSSQSSSSQSSSSQSSSSSSSSSQSSSSGGSSSSSSSSNGQSSSSSSSGASSSSLKIFE